MWWSSNWLVFANQWPIDSHKNPNKKISHYRLLLSIIDSWDCKYQVALRVKITLATLVDSHLRLTENNEGQDKPWSYLDLPCWSQSNEHESHWESQDKRVISTTLINWYWLLLFDINYQLHRLGFRANHHCHYR